MTPTQAAKVVEGVVSKALIEALEAAFPNRLPDSLADPREIDAKIGEQRVVRYLKSALARAERPSTLEVLPNV